MSIARSELLKISLLAAGAAVGPAVLATGPAAAAAEAAAEAAAATAAREAGPVIPNAATLSKVVLRTLRDCQLGVSIYPGFDYDASGGGGAGTAVLRDDGLLHVSFDAAALSVPALELATTRVLGLPLPPPLRIEIVPRRLEGTVDPATGAVNLDFDAQFLFSAGPVYTAPPLAVLTRLTSGSSSGVLRSGTGTPLSATGHARLAGVARVPVTGDGLLDGFLQLPSDALAVLSAELTFE